MIRIQVYLTQQLYQKIDIIAHTENKAADQVVRELLEKGLSTRKNPITIGNAFLKLTKINAQGGPKNLSSKIDDYLYS